MYQIQGTDAPVGSNIPTNETKTVNEFVDMWKGKLDSLPFIDPNQFNGLKMVADAAIVQGTYLVGFKEAEGVFAMKLLESVSKMPGADTSALAGQLNCLKPILELAGVMSLWDIHRVSFPEVQVRHSV